MEEFAPIVLKLGGSLLTMPDLFDRLHSVAAMLKTHRVLLIPGGGVAADTVRRLDDRFRLSAEAAHRDAIAAMSTNAAMLARLSGFLRLAASREEAVSVWESGRLAILDAATFLRDEERCVDANPLPASWDVTSDSIAAWIAIRWPARRLIFAKSCDMNGLSVRELIAQSRLDAWLSRLCGDIPMGWLNLRCDPLTILALEKDSDEG